jgi:Protein of unknown function (DUF2690)
MLRARVKALLAAVLVAVAAGVISVGLAVPAQAAATCYWYSGQVGNSSNCDGQDPDALGAACGGDGRTVYTVRMVRSYDGDPSGPYLDLRYSGNCRTVWARIRGGWGASGDQTGCFVAIHRNSDGQEYSSGLPYGSVNATAWTRVAYDANVSSYAWAVCDTGPGFKYNGQTANW